MRIQRGYLYVRAFFHFNPNSHSNLTTLVRRFVFHIFPAKSSRFQTVLFCRGIAVDHGSLQMGIAPCLDLEPLVSCIDPRLFRHAFVIGTEGLFLGAATSGNMASSDRDGKSPSCIPAVIGLPVLEAFQVQIPSGFHLYLPAFHPAPGQEGVPAAYGMELFLGLYRTSLMGQTAFFFIFPALVSIKVISNPGRILPHPQGHTGPGTSGAGAGFSFQGIFCRLQGKVSAGFQADVLSGEGGTFQCQVFLCPDGYVFLPGNPASFGTADFRLAPADQKENIIVIIASFVLSDSHWRFLKQCWRPGFQI